MSLPADIKDVFFRTVKGDTTLEEFEIWVYGEKSLEQKIDPEFYLDLISLNYKKKRSKV